MSALTSCALCGRSPAAGYAGINGVRYCHGDEKPSCYESASHIFTRTMFERRPWWRRWLSL